MKNICISIIPAVYLLREETDLVGSVISTFGSVMTNTELLLLDKCVSVGPGSCRDNGSRDTPDFSFTFIPFIPTTESYDGGDASNLVSAYVGSGISTGRLLQVSENNSKSFRTWDNSKRLYNFIF